ncbi:hypothetical protein SK128_014770, partial [Halocaridina rubra]
MSSKLNSHVRPTDGTMNEISMKADQNSVTDLVLKSTKTKALRLKEHHNAYSLSRPKKMPHKCSRVKKLNRHIGAGKNCEIIDVHEDKDYVNELKHSNTDENGLLIHTLNTARQSIQIMNVGLSPLPSVAESYDLGDKKFKDFTENTDVYKTFLKNVGFDTKLIVNTFDIYCKRNDSCGENEDNMKQQLLASTRKVMVPLENKSGPLNPPLLLPATRALPSSSKSADFGKQESIDCNVIGDEEGLSFGDH